MTVKQEVRGLLPPPKKERKSLRSMGNLAEVRSFKRHERGRKKKFVERRERRLHGNPYARFHASHVLNLLHDALPDVFPRTIEARNLRFEADPVHKDSMTPVMESPYIKKKWRRVPREVITETVDLLTDAGFEVDRYSENLRYGKIDGKVTLIIFEVDGFNPRKLNEFLEKRGIELKPSIWSEVLKSRDACVTDLIEKGLKDENIKVRRSSAYSLSVLGGAKALSALKEYEKKGE